MDALTRDRELRLLGVELRGVSGVEYDVYVDEEDDSLLRHRLLRLAGVETRDFDAALHPRDGEGKFRTVFARVNQALTAWAKGDGPDRPISALKLSRPSLMKVSRRIGYEPKRGELPESIEDGILARAREIDRARRGDKPAAPNAPEPDAPDVDRVFAAGDREQAERILSRLTQSEFEQGVADPSRTRKELADVSRLLGLSTSGTKDVLRKRLVDRAAELRKGSGDASAKVPSAKAAKAAPKAPAGEAAKSPTGRITLSARQRDLLGKAAASDTIDVDKSDPDVQALVAAGYIDLDPRSNRAEINGRGALKAKLLRLDAPAKKATPAPAEPMTGEGLRDSMRRYLGALPKTSDRLSQQQSDHFAASIDGLAGVDPANPAALHEAAARFRASAESMRGPSGMRLANNPRDSRMYKYGKHGVAVADQFENVADALDRMARDAGTPKPAKKATPRKATPRAPKEAPAGPDIEVAKNRGELSPTEIAQGETLTLAGRKAVNALGPQGHPRIAAIVDTEQKIREAYRMLARGGGADSYVSLENLRKLIGNQTPRSEVDKVLKRLAFRPDSGVRLAPQSYARENATTRIPAAVLVAGQEQNLLHIDDPSLARVGEFPALDLAEELVNRRNNGARHPMMVNFTDAQLREEVNARIARDPVVARDIASEVPGFAAAKPAGRATAKAVAAKAPKEAPADVDKRVRDAYASLPKSDTGFVSIADIRDRLGDLSREDQDAALRRLATSPDAEVIPIANAKSIAPRFGNDPRIRDAGIVIGGEEQHVIRIGGSASRSADLDEDGLIRSDDDLNEYGDPDDEEDVEDELGDEDDDLDDDMDGDDLDEEDVPVRAMSPEARARVLALGRLGETRQWTQEDEDQHPRGTGDKGGEFVSKNADNSKVGQGHRPMKTPQKPKTQQKKTTQPKQQQKPEPKAKPKADTDDEKYISKPAKRRGPMKVGGDNDPAQVKELQALLRSLGLSTQSVNGTYDRATENAVKEAQNKLGLRPTGRASSALVKKMLAAHQLSPCAKGGKRDVGHEFFELRRGLVAGDFEEESLVDFIEELRASDGNQLKHYWTRGEGLAKWRTKPHPWTALRNHLLKHVGPTRAERMASDWFHEVFGYWPGHRKGSNPVGPG